MSHFKSLITKMTTSYDDGKGLGWYYGIKHLTTEIPILQLVIIIYTTAIQIQIKNKTSLNYSLSTQAITHYHYNER